MIQLQELAHHRNGVSGAGFYVARVNLTEDTETSPCTAIFFPQTCDGAPTHSDGRIALIRDNASLDFHENSLRGNDLLESLFPFWISVLTHLEDTTPDWYQLPYPTRMTYLRTSILALASSPAR